MNLQETNWYKTAVFYEVNTRTFFDSNGDGKGDLAGVQQKLGYLKELGVDCIWLLPIYSSPLRDGGYDISDFCDIHPDLGTLADLKSLVAATHEKGMRIIMDLVLNHSSDQHRWFQAAQADRNSPYRDYYVWSDSDRKYQDVRIIFLDSEKSNWAWEEKSGQYYWHRFYSFQPDLNYDNPKVRAEMIAVMDFWLAIGIDGFRVDAVPYLIEREGTNCENLPQTHEVLKEMRRFVDEKYPGRILLCEANQPPVQVREYMGNGDEFQLAFHFPLMPRIYMALKKGDFGPIRQTIEQTPSIPENCQWCTFLRNHDELTLEMVSEEERQWMWQEYAPDPGMRLNLGIRRRLAPLLDNDAQKILLAYSLLFSLPGTPVLYYGDEIGMGDDIRRPDRDGVRSPMQWDASARAGFTTSSQPYAEVLDSQDYSPRRVNVADAMQHQSSLWNHLRRLMRLRKEHEVLATGKFEAIHGLPAAVGGYYRRDDQERLLILNHLSAETQSISLELSDVNELHDLISSEIFRPKDGKVALTLQAHEFRWFKVT
jgi:trehalose synthase